MPLLLNGKALAKQVEQDLAARTDTLTPLLGRSPCLATVLVGQDPASATYVRMKQKACARVGIKSIPIELAGSSTTADVLAAVESLNQDPTVDGILLQHPVPSQVDERACFDAIRGDKDVDGVTSQGLGRLSLGLPTWPSCTPGGIMHLLSHHNIQLEGLAVTVIGRSPILGLPMAMLAQRANATVTICHSRTKNLAQHTRSADVIVAAVGIPHFVTPSDLGNNQILIDAGYHPSEKCGDMAFTTDVIQSCRAYTPVPGGVGPMTIATLLKHTVESADRRV